MSSETEPRSEDVRLSLAFIPDAQKRADVGALFALLETLRDIPARVTEPLMGQIRLCWWLEAFEEIRDGRAPRYHPLTEYIQRLIEQYGLPVRAFLDMVEGQEALFDRPLSLRDAMDVVEAGEATVTALAVQMLDPAADPASGKQCARLCGLTAMRAGGFVRPDDFGPEEQKHIRIDARVDAAHLPSNLMPLALPAVLAQDQWRGKPAGPLSRRWRLLTAFITGKI
ncbi:MAG TPA: squalene/phytoene synthase family protein [Asticcacaulis sp.]|nr:squalene/phytoene synthase family protein [Asticcacaulis sp.]